MAALELARYTVKDGEVDEFLESWERAVRAIRGAFPGLETAALARIDETTFIDFWRWDTRPHAEAAARGAPSVAEAAAMFGHIAQVLTMEHAQIVREDAS